MRFHFTAFKKAIGVLLLTATAVTGCTGTQIHRATAHHTISLDRDKLLDHCVAFLTPSTPTGYEEDKQALVLGFVDVLNELRDGVCIVPLSETLGAINNNSLADEYLAMYQEYKETGLFKRKALKKISDVTHARYLVQLNLSGFSQRSIGRFSVFGWRLIDTQIGNIRLFAQVWDGQQGTIAWEGSQELNYAGDTFSAKPVTFRLVVREAAEDLVRRLPHVAAKDQQKQAAESAEETVLGEHDQRPVHR